MPRAGKLLVLINGAYGQRALRIARIAGRAVASLETPEDTPSGLERLERMLAEDAAINHVLAVHCETTSGILNPIVEVAALVARHGRRLLVDSMSTFGALPIDARQVRYGALAASSSKCLEGPGRGLRADRAVPFHAAHPGHRGGMGFRTLLDDRLQAPIIVTFHMPTDPKFVFQRFYDGLKERGYVIYPGKLTVADSFRMGCIGHLHPEHMTGALAAVREVLDEMRVSHGGQALAAE